MHAEIGPNSSLKVVITYIPEGRVYEKGDMEKVTLIVQDGNDIDLTCHGLVQEGKIIAQQRQLGIIYGQVPIGEDCKKSLKLRNPSPN